MATADKEYHLSTDFIPIDSMEWPSIESRRAELLTCFNMAAKVTAAINAPYARDFDQLNKDVQETDLLFENDATGSTLSAWKKRLTNLSVTLQFIERKLQPDDPQTKRFASAGKKKELHDILIGEMRGSIKRTSRAIKEIETYRTYRHEKKHAQKPETAG